MKQSKIMRGWIVTVAFVAATLQGSRLPEPIVGTEQQTAIAVDSSGHRMGSGSDQDGDLPLPDRASA
jgi:hypothetical protein